MSTVLERYRDLSNFEYFTTATRVRKEITALVTSAAKLIKGARKGVKLIGQR